MYIYVRTFLIRVRVLVICDRNSIATKREEFLARVVEVASSCFHFASLAFSSFSRKPILHYASSQYESQYHYYKNTSFFGQAREHAALDPILVTGLPPSVLSHPFHVN